MDTTVDTQTSEPSYESAESACEDIKSDAEITEPQNDEDYASSEESGAECDGAVDYDAIIADDIRSLKSEFPELSSLEDITELDNPVRYAALRDLGLTPKEAYLATSKRPAADNRSHLRAAYGRHTTTPKNTMSREEMAIVKDVFAGLSDSEIISLYKRVRAK